MLVIYVAYSMRNPWNKSHTYVNYENTYKSKYNICCNHDKDTEL